VNAAAVDEIVKLGEDRGSWLIFCSGVQHAEHIRDEIRSRGIECEAVLGETTSTARDRILTNFKAGRLRALTNANVLTTGFDAPGVDLIGLLRPTKSVGLYVQMLGRGTRLAEGKENCLILDFAGNTARHGPLDTVDGRTRKDPGEGDAPVKECPECQTICHASVRECPSCGFQFPPPKVKIDAIASANAILSTQVVAEWVEVSNVSYHRHEKPGGVPSMRVDYWCGLVKHSEWVCFEHLPTSYPRQKACSWWHKRAPSEPVPADVAEALAMAQIGIRTPVAIQVKPVGKYTEILAYHFGE
jgi:DNA repair protein RadD